MREIDTSVNLPRKFVFYLTLVAIVTVIGPFGTYNALSLWDRFAFWLVDFSAVAVFAHIGVYTAFSVNLFNKLSGTTRLCIGGVLGAIPSTAAVMFIYKVFAPEAAAALIYPKVYLEIAVISAPMLLTEFVVIPAVVQKTKGTEEEIAEPVDETPPMEPAAPLAKQPDLPSALKDRLPPEMHGARICSISMQDHYAHITTDRGNAMLLMRMGDLVDLLSGIEGIQIHRSHWVATAEIEKIEKNGRKHHVHLRDGRVLPVSSNRLDQARAQIERAQETV